MSALPANGWLHYIAEHPLLSGAILLRAVFLLAGQAALGGDGLGYVQSAQELLATGKLPPTPSQAVSFSVLIAPILAALGAAGRLDYKSIPYPGYPGYINDPIASWVHVFQVAMDIVIVLILINEARRLLAPSSPKLATIACVLLAVQPFTAMYTTHVLADHTTMFSYFVGGYLLYRYQSGGGASWLALGSGAFLLGIASWLRFDMVPVCVATAGIFLLVVLRTHGIAPAARILAIGLPLFLVAPVSMLALQYKSTGEIGYVRLGISGASYDWGRGGYYAWVRKWLILYPAEMQLAGWADHGGDKNWRGFDVANYPSRAFAGDAQRQDVQRLLSQWRQTDYTPEIDAGFQRIATDYASGRPIMALALVPAARMLHFWINLEGARAIQATFRLKPPWSQYATAAVFPFRLLFVLLGLAGIGVLWLRDWRQWADWHDPAMFARICSVMVLLRTAEMGVLGMLVQSGLMEPRYVLPAIPAMLLLAVVGLHWLASLSLPGLGWLRPDAERAQRAP